MASVAARLSATAQTCDARQEAKRKRRAVQTSKGTSVSREFSRNNPNIEDPVDGGREPNPDVDMPPGAGSGSGSNDPQPIPPDKGPQPPIEEPPDQPGRPDNQPDPPPMGDPKPNEPTRLV